MVCFLSPFINVLFLCKIFKFQSFVKCKFPFILQRTFCRRQEYEVREGVLGWEPKTWVPGLFFFFFTILLHDFGQVTSLYNISSSFPGCLCGPVSHHFPLDGCDNLLSPGPSTFTSPPPAHPPASKGCFQ